MKHKPCLKLRKPKWGVGINDILESSQAPHIKPFYKTWQNLIMRCYNPSFQKGRYVVYRGYTVHPDWHKFSNFKTWMEKQDWQGKELDKDVLGEGEKIYSPDTCAFVSIYTNRVFRKFERKNRNIKIDTRQPHYKNRKRYSVCISKFGKVKYFGHYYTIEEAKKEERKPYSQYIRELSDYETDPRIKAKLLKIADKIEYDS